MTSSDLETKILCVWYSQERAFITQWPMSDSVTTETMLQNSDISLQFFEDGNAARSKRIGNTAVCYR